eukprot:9596791-Alexandrium_andersonii.AAC.1
MPDVVVRRPRRSEPCRAVSNRRNITGVAVNNSRPITGVEESTPHHVELLRVADLTMVAM